ncbi:hypothetical protein SAMN03159332_0386 [Paenibacillus sp. 276b]|nr:hypothetical protein SAMN03159332_0386 [Paenibacillus sp. 276b]
MIRFMDTTLKETKLTVLKDRVYDTICNSRSSDREQVYPEIR